jgi:sirohydrochlorin cobaltochelatase
MNGVILFAHGSRDPRWADPFEAVAAALRQRAPHVAVRLAYLELMTPDLATAANSLIAGEGATRIDVLPLFLGAGNHLKRDLPPMLDALRAAHPGVRFTLHAAVGEHPLLTAALADIALATTSS